MYVTERYEEHHGLGRASFVTGGVLLGVGGILAYQLMVGVVVLPGGERAPLWLGPAAGLPLAMLGAALMTFRAGTVVDSVTRNAFSWWGFGKPWKRRFYPLAHYRFLTIRVVHESQDAEGVPVYFVSMLNDEDQGVDVYRSADYWAARREAGELARMLQMPVHDRSGEQEMVLKPGERHSSLRARLLGAGERPPYPPRPPECRVAVQFTGDEADMDIPHAGMGAFVWFLLVTGFLAVFGSLGYSGYVIRGSGRAITVPVYIGLGVLLAIGVGLGLFLIIQAVRSAVLHEHIVASPRQVSVMRHGLIRGSDWLIDVKDIEYVDVRQGQVRIIDADGRTIAAGTTIGEQEREYVRDMIRHVITAPARKKGSTSFY